MGLVIAYLVALGKAMLSGTQQMLHFRTRGTAALAAILMRSRLHAPSHAGMRAQLCASDTWMLEAPDYAIRCACVVSGPKTLNIIAARLSVVSPDGCGGAARQARAQGHAGAGRL